MKKGISTNVSIMAKAACLAENGIGFALRYYSKPGSSKAISVDEARAISEAGIRLGVVYQERARSIADFTMSKARDHASNAWNSAKALDQPANSAIYFAVDYDATVTELQGTILNYFNEVNRVIAGLAGGSNPYHLGVYGSGRTCKYLKNNCPSVRYTWLSLSKGWADSKTFNGWDLNQNWGEGNLCGLTPVYVAGGKLFDGDYEYNDDDGEFGGFFPGVPIATAVPDQPGPADIVSELEFRMELGSGATLRLGELLVKGAQGEMLLQASATSGRTGYQNAGNQWDKSMGPLPAREDYNLETLADMPESNGHLGVRFGISPFEVTSPNGAVTRSGFSLRGRDPLPGTSGGILLPFENDFTRLRRLLAATSLAGVKSVPLKVTYTGGALDYTDGSVANLGAVFSMKLKKSKKLIYGTFSIRGNDGDILYSGIATSGLAGFQDEGNFWSKNLGVIPPTDDERFIVTNVYSHSSPMGTRYQITPEKVTNSNTGVTRSEFRVHFDSGTPGSAGCIVTPTRSDYDKIIALFAELSARGVEKIPLTLDYT